MRLTPVLCVPPKFNFWKDFGAGKRHRMPFFKHWYQFWRVEIARKKVADHTLAPEFLPAGARLMNAEDFLHAHIDALPDEILKSKGRNDVFDHPWPYNVKLDPVRDQEPMHSYSIDSRLYFPRDDAQVLTNTSLEASNFAAEPPFEPSEAMHSLAQRQYDWSTRGDSVLVKLPGRRQFPKINIKPNPKFGITKERQENHILASLFDISQSALAQHLSQRDNNDKSLDELLSRRSIAFPHCHVPFTRGDRKLDLNLTVEQLAISSAPLPLINHEPEATRERQPVDIKPRSWKSIIEQSRNYRPSWSFTLPRNSNLHTIQLASRIKRDHLDSHEMLARSMIHAFGVASQFARLRAHQRLMDHREDSSKQASVVLEDPLSINEVNQKDRLDQPIVLQTIAFDLTMGQFHFMRYQLNTLLFDDANKNRIKNQAWYSGPVHDLREALRYYIDFQAFSHSTAHRLMAPREDQVPEEQLEKELQEQ